MINNYGNYPNYQNDYENSRQTTDNENEKVVIIKKDNNDGRVSIFHTKFENFTRLHWNEFKYTLIGIIIALLFLTIGFFRTLLIIILYLIGNLYGRYKDGDPKTLYLLERFLKRY